MKAWGSGSGWSYVCDVRIDHQRGKVDFLVGHEDFPRLRQSMDIRFLTDDAGLEQESRLVRDEKAAKRKALSDRIRELGDTPAMIEYRQLTYRPQCNPGYSQIIDEY